MTNGRPRSFKPELAKEICEAIATSSKGLIALCKANPHWPSRETIFKWRLNNEGGFSDMYADAKASQVEALVDECLDISDDSHNDTQVNDSGKQICNSEYINRSRLRVDTRKWIAQKLAPRIYGERTEKIADDSSKALMEKLIDKL